MKKYVGGGFAISSRVLQGKFGSTASIVVKQNRIRSGERRPTRSEPGRDDDPEEVQ